MDDLAEINALPLIRAEQQRQNPRVDLIGLDLRLRGEAGFKGVGQPDMLAGQAALQHFVEPVPVHGGLEDHARMGPALEELGKGFRRVMLDAALPEALSGYVHGVIDAVTFMIVDPDEGGCFGRHLGHSRCRLDAHSILILPCPFSRSLCGR